jgi:dolichyl-phosphate-mannose--protein O-mannosyl transferase
MYMYIYIYIYIIIYEIKYKTNVVTQSFMPAEFTDNLRTTKVLLKYIYIYIIS